MPNTFLDKSTALLEEIEMSPKKLEWCKRYSVYNFHSEGNELSRSINTFMNQAYANGLVITNYQQVIEQYNLDETDIENAEFSWLEQQSYLPTLACIAYHFRRDHFNEGSLIRESIGSGAMLRMLRHLKSQSFGNYIATTLETLYRFSCEGIPDKPGVYWVLAPKDVPIRFESTALNLAAPLYHADILSQKYADCCDKQILYIGKASGKGGLQQRVQQYIKYGWNEAVNHKGGRAVWQIRDAGILLLTYEPCSDCIAWEHTLLHEYKEANGCYPLANWRG